jgi:hypothetical protein
MNARMAATLVLMLAGLTLIAIPAVLSGHTPWREIAQHAGLAIVVVAGVALLEPTLAKWVHDPQSWSERFGLVEIRAERQLFDRETARLLAHATDVRIAATCLNALLAPWRKELIAALEARLTSGRTVPIRMIVVSPGSPAMLERLMLDDLSADESLGAASLARWQQSVADLMTLASRYPEQLRVLQTPFGASASVFLLDDQLYVTPYIYGRRGSRAICYHCKRTDTVESVYQAYDDSFERYWQFLQTRGTNDAHLSSAPDVA